MEVEKPTNAKPNTKTNASNANTNVNVNGNPNGNTPRHVGPPPPATLFDKRTGSEYVTGKLLGEGGFARCYQVTGPSGEPLAAKIIRKDSLKTQKQKAKLFAEIKIHQTMNHPAIVAFNHVFEDDENVYIILELCENGASSWTMVEFLKTRKRLSEPETRYYMHHLLNAVNYMHKNRVIHRDLKLGNMFLAKDMRLKIGDFGLAALITYDGERKKTICGTPNYIAPEVLFGAQHDGHSFEVDMWSLGVVMYTQLIGKPPFQTKEVKAIYKKIRDNNYEFPPQISISESAKDVINALLNNKPEYRPSVEEVLQYPFFTKEPVPYSIPVSALTSIPTIQELNIIVQSPLHSSSSITLSNGSQNMSQPSSSTSVPPPQRAPLPRIPSAVNNQSANSSHRTSAITAIPKPSSPVPKSPITAVASNFRATNNISRQTTTQQQAEAAENSTHISANTATRAASPRVYIESLGGVLSRSSAAPVAIRTATRGVNGMAITSQSAGQIEAIGGSSGGRGLAIVNGEEDSGNGKDIQEAQSDEQKREIGIMKKISKNTVLGESGIQNQYFAKAAVAMQEPEKMTSKGEPFFNLRLKDLTQVLAPMFEPQPSRSSTLEIMYKNIKNAIISVDSGKYVENEDEDVFIIKWIDYSNKYGLGYQLQDGSVGVYFNDSTSILLAADAVHIEYLYYETSENPGGLARMHRRQHTVNSFPDSLKKKVTLLNHFGGYMKENLFKSVDAGLSSRSSDLIFLTKYLRAKNGVIFRLSNQVVQINFFDHTKLVLSQNGTIITYINKGREARTKRLETFLASGDKEVVDRISYAKDTLQQMIMKKRSKTAIAVTVGDVEME
ncbi:Cell cycle serine/threonine-protein kinase cdc5/MSD2 [Physocladia obscura]|uniref:Serine/threonine-protein kinase n=1 Tax=Physocladia obscura TaxID=109957 RepID=A0AAD5T3W1_9FUNG|nr:Cell cycle serine/threonine-protein kinase cdc5/MSD2 [Physocladia obscura]